MVPFFLLMNCMSPFHPEIEQYRYIDGHSLQRLSLQHLQWTAQQRHNTTPLCDLREQAGVSQLKEAWQLTHQCCILMCFSHVRWAVCFVNCAVTPSDHRDVTISTPHYASVTFTQMASCNRGATGPNQTLCERGYSDKTIGSFEMDCALHEWTRSGSGCRGNNFLSPHNDVWSCIITRCTRYPLSYLTWQGSHPVHSGLMHKV